MGALAFSGPVEILLVLLVATGSGLGTLAWWRWRKAVERFTARNLESVNSEVELLQEIATDVREIKAIAIDQATASLYRRSSREAPSEQHPEHPEETQHPLGES